ncbi:hypothetical protein PTSG_09668 [Salpingoeca rosetta]|uniref:Lysophosphatidic acid phosphatase type 6 n=1 Tax=Salpingoeca rosetta (strain ATCC 50818 / BSB-021) TaxID=946362 RepID=F2ULN2_SALR5|nr:uncharacterized protein PTSG_09668 [Salpingoeca rosetta]EGD78031.1 hypothetical protein PTSG_09668 [Salpingoeca rosetta]|eukprot:XP_004990093.1 hypothetical protein PTSG_09668 [Salpingoeca rosetta]
MMWWRRVVGTVTVLGTSVPLAAAAAAVTTTASDDSDGAGSQGSQGSRGSRGGQVVDQDKSTVHLEDGRALRLVQVQAYFRHGARTPIHAIPGEVDEEHWDERLCAALPDIERPLRITGPDNQPRPICAANMRQKQTRLPGGCHIGCLTLLGRHEAFTLGQRLREQYMDAFHFLPSMYQPQDVAVRSTNFDRTIETARLVISGLYGTKGMHAHVTTIPVEEEFLTPNTRACPRLRELFVEARKNREADRHSAAKQLKQRLASLLRVDGKEVHFVGIRDALVARHAHSKEVPAFLDGSVRKAVDQYAVDDVVSLFKYHQKESLTLSCGLLLKNMLSHFKSAQDPTQAQPRMRMFSCHDTTLLPMLLCFGIFDGKWPPFAADICIELYRDENSVDDHYVRVLYCGEPQRLPLATDHYCSYKTFEGALNSLVPDDFKEACKVARKRDDPATAAAASQSSDSFKA